MTIDNLHGVPERSISARQMKCSFRIDAAVLRWTIYDFEWNVVGVLRKQDSLPSKDREKRTSIEAGAHSTSHSVMNS
jgi:hypothetical protein